MRQDDPYELLDVPRDASPDRIRRAYEIAINRAHRDGATARAVAQSRAYDTLSDPARRLLYDRHGLAPLRERSPGAAPPAMPWRVAKQQPLTRPAAHRTRRPWRAAVPAVFCLGIVVGLVLAVYVQRQPSQVMEGVPAAPREHQILCDTTSAGQGFIYSEPATNAPSCANGAVPRVLG